MANHIHVAVAVIRRADSSTREVLIAKRPVGVHQGGLWEFPGGKVEPGESCQAALARELKEELDIELSVNDQSTLPLTRIYHDYGDKKVFLDVWEVSAFSGTPKGAEGQDVRWVEIDRLREYDFPRANAPILSAIRIPRQYIITPEYENLTEAMKALSCLFEQSNSLIRLRQPQLSAQQYAVWLKAILENLAFGRNSLMVNFDPDFLASDVKIAGYHLTADQAKLLGCRPAIGNLWLGVSCHDESEIGHAERLGADLITLSPVNATRSHPGKAGIGWSAFKELARSTSLPVFALGGVEPKDTALAVESGAHGVCGIRGWQPPRYT